MEKTKTHQIKLSDLQACIAEDQKILFARSSSEKKEIYATTRGSFEVWHNGNKVWEGVQPFSAVEKYNEL